MRFTGGSAFLTAVTETTVDIQNLLAITFLPDSVMEEKKKLGTQKVGRCARLIPCPHFLLSQ